MVALMSTSPVVLITGCSSGIGRETARHFAARGYRVYASMRQPERGAALREEASQRGWSLFVPALDVTSDDSVSGAVKAILAETGGRIDVLVNNAGYFSLGPIEETSPDELRAQIETNVIGVQRMIRAVLPAMRARGDGAIVNISSVSGRVVLPVVGPYHVSKFAVEALTEALRYEVLPFGVRVTCVEPGSYKSDLHAKEVQSRESRRSESPYQPLVAAYRAAFRRQPRANLDSVVNVIFRAATHARPKLRWPVGPSSFTGTFLRRLTPDGIYEWVLRIVFRWRRLPVRR